MAKASDLSDWKRVFATHGPSREAEVDDLEVLFRFGGRKIIGERAIRALVEWLEQNGFEAVLPITLDDFELQSNKRDAVLDVTLPDGTWLFVSLER